MAMSLHMFFSILSDDKQFSSWTICSRHFWLSILYCQHTCLPLLQWLLKLCLFLHTKPGLHPHWYISTILDMLFSFSSMFLNHFYVLKNDLRTWVGRQQARWKRFSRYCMQGTRMGSGRSGGFQSGRNKTIQTRYWKSNTDNKMAR